MTASWRRTGATVFLGLTFLAGLGCGGGGAKPDGSADGPKDARDAALSDATADSVDVAATETATDAVAEAPEAGDAPAETAGDAPGDTADAAGDAADATTDAAGDATAEVAPPIDAGVGCVGPGVEPSLTPAGAGFPSTGLVLWVRADRGVYKTEQNAVCGWLDQSGHGHFLHPSTARPTWEPTAVGGKPAIHYAAVNQDTYVDGVVGLTPTSGRTFVAVSQLVTANGRFHPILQGQSGTPGTYVGIDANTWMTAGSREGAYVTVNSFDSALATSTTPRLHVLSLSTMTPGTTVTSALGYRVDGVAQTLTLKDGQTGGLITSFANANFTTVGGVSSTPSSGVAAGNAYVAEALIYDHALNTTELAAVEAALKARYAIP